MPRTNNEKAGICVRERGNWGTLKPTHKFDGKSFNKDQFLKDLPIASPKLSKLLDKIKELDEKDMAKHNHKFKHFIYSDMKSPYGTKLIAAGLLAAGYEHAYSHSGSFSLLPFPSGSFSSKGNRFATLTSTSMFEKPIGVNFRRQLFKAFNARPDNVYGDNIRIVLLDSGFREGVDLFDVKYVHLFEPIVTASDEKQAIGRATRYCGQKGLKFDRVRGWPLHVYRYETTIPKHVQSSITKNIPDLSPTSFFDTFMYYSNIDPRKMKFAAELINMAMEGAVDKEYTKNIHTTAVGGAETESKYKWPKMKMENMCAAPISTSLKLTPTQEFIKDTFTPNYDKHGMLLVHSVGTGKTCNAIATASSSFEAADYTIIYVTRYTLKADVWKNMFEQVCSVVVKDYLASGKPLPENHAARMKLISQKWIDPVSYKQFSNMLSNKSQLYNELVKLNGSKDILQKTLVIIDEAHKLFASDVEGQEKADVDVIRSAFQNSYAKSGKDSVKVAFMTATPYTSEPMDMIRLLNLFRDKSETMPENFEDFAKVYLDESGSFSTEGKKEFMKDIKGYISYLNREKDMRSFAYPVMHEVRVPMSEYEYTESIKAYKETIKELQDVKNEYDVAKKSENEGLADEKTAGLAKIQAAYDALIEEYNKCTADIKANANNKANMETGFKDMKAKFVAAKNKCIEEHDAQFARDTQAARASLAGNREELAKALDALKSRNVNAKAACQASYNKNVETMANEKTARVKQAEDFKGARKGECKTLKDRAEANKKTNTKELTDLIKQTKQKRKEHVELLQNKYKEVVAKDKKAKNDLKNMSKDDLSQLTGVEQCFTKAKSKYRTMAMSMSADDMDWSAQESSADDHTMSEVTAKSSNRNSKSGSIPEYDSLPDYESLPEFNPEPATSSKPKLTDLPDIGLPDIDDIEEDASDDNDDDNNIVNNDNKKAKLKLKKKNPVPKRILKKLRQEFSDLSEPLFGPKKVVPNDWEHAKRRLLYRLVSAQAGHQRSRILSQITKRIRLMDHVIENMDTAPDKLVAEEEDEDGLIRIRKYNIYSFEKNKYNLHLTLHGVIPSEVQSSKYKKCNSKALADKIVKLYNRKRGFRLVTLPKTTAEWMADPKKFDSVCQAARAWS